MSGGFVGYAQRKEPEELLSQRYEEKLRQAAQVVEEGTWWTEELEEKDQEELAALLEIKADKIADAREEIRRSFSGSENESLLKAVDYAGAGDYGPEKVKEAWEEYKEAGGRD